MLDAPRAADASGCVDPQSVVDVATVGLGVQHVDVGAGGAQHARPELERGAVRAVEHDAQPVERAPVERGDEVRDVLVDAAIVAAIATRRPAAAGAVGERASRSSCFDRGLDVVGQLAAAGARCSFTPLSVHGLWLAEIDRGRRRRRAARGTRPPASAATPSDTTAAPSRREPAAQRRPRCAGPTRACRARRRTRRAPSTRAAARPSATTNRCGEIGVRVAADAVGAEPQHAARRRYRFEYCGALRAFLRPYLRRSFSRASRREEPGLLQHAARVGVERDRAPGRCRGGSHRPGRSRRRRRAWRRRRRPLRSA